MPSSSKRARVAFLRRGLVQLCCVRSLIYDLHDRGVFLATID